MRIMLCLYYNIHEENICIYDLKHLKIFSQTVSRPRERGTKAHNN